MDTARKGDTLVVTTGEYSDYSSRGLFRVERDFNPQEVLVAYLKLHPEQDGAYTLNNTALLNYLTANGYLEEVEPPIWRELHLPEYGCASRGIKLFDSWMFLS